MFHLHSSRKKSETRKKKKKKRSRPPASSDLHLVIGVSEEELRGLLGDGVGDRHSMQ